MSIAVAIEQIKQADLPDATRLNAYNLVQLVHTDTGYVCLRWDELSAVFGCGKSRIQVHLTELQAVNLIHYSSNGDGLVYLTFKAWTPASGVKERGAGKHSRQNDEKIIAEQRLDHRKTMKKSLKNDDLIAAPESTVKDEQRLDHRKTMKKSLKNDDSNGATYTHASAHSGWLDGSTTDPDPDGNQPTNPQRPQTPKADGITSDEAERSLALMTAVNMRRDIAGELSGLIHFELVRAAVGAWFEGRKSKGGKFQEDPGIVVNWLRHPEKFKPVMPDSFRRTDLYRQFRTPAEVAEDEERERQAISPPAAAARASPPGPSPYLDDDPGWRTLVADGLADELAGLVEIGEVDGVPLYRFACKQAWVNQRSAVPLRKALSSIVGKPVLVDVVPSPKEA